METLIESKVDVIFSNSFLHLFKEEERNKIINKIYNSLKNNGIAYFSVSSDEDIDFNKGDKVGVNLVKNGRGVTKFYYNKKIISKEFNIFNKIHINKFKEKHYHDFEHDHTNFIIKCEKY